jgi:Tol biopolymer transport system component
MKKSSAGGSPMRIKNYFIPLAVLAVVFMAYSFQDSSDHKVLFEKAKFTMESKGDLKTAIKLFNELIEKYPDERVNAAKAQLYIGICLEKLGFKEAEKAFQKVIDNYPDQTEAVKAAREKLSILQRARAVLDKDDSGFNIRLINSSPDVDPFSVSPDGRFISYSDWNGGLLGVYEVATGKKRYLDEKGSQVVLASCWSPDGKWIAYNPMDMKDMFWDLRIIGAEGTEPRVLYRDKNYFIYPLGWSPDGQFVLVCLNRAEGQKMLDSNIALVSVEDGSVDIVKTFNFPDPDGINKAVFSPDGRYIAFEYCTEEGSKSRDISVISKDGKKEISLIKNPADDSLLSWTPDGNNFLFVSDCKGTQDLWMTRVEEGEPKGEPLRIKTNIGDIYSLGFTSNGSFLYKVSVATSDIYWAELDAEEGLLTNARKVIKRSLGANFSPEWSTDGKSMAYVSAKVSEGLPGEKSLRILSLETGEEREVARPAKGEFGTSYALRWSPDGRSLLTLGGGNAHITDVSTGKSTTVKLDKSGEKLFHPAWSKDGKTIYYLDTSWKKNLTRIMAHDIETGNFREIASDINNPLWLDISPDRNTLAYAVPDTDTKSMVIRTVSVSGGEKHDVAKVQVRGHANALCWAPDGQSIYCEFSTGLWNFPVNGGKPKKIYKGKDLSFSELRVHPDGKRFAFSIRKGSFELWTMDNFLPEKKKD